MSEFKKIKLSWSWGETADPVPRPTPVGNAVLYVVVLVLYFILSSRYLVAPSQSVTGWAREPVKESCHVGRKAEVSCWALGRIPNTGGYQSPDISYIYMPAVLCRHGPTRTTNTPYLPPAQFAVDVYTLLFQFRLTFSWLLTNFTTAVFISLLNRFFALTIWN